MKNVLMISYPFAPWGGGSTVRIHKFVKYLPKFGWNPIVLTAKEEYYHYTTPIDRTVYREIPGSIKIIRTKVLSPSSSLQDKRQRQSDINSNIVPTVFLGKLGKLRKSLLIPDGYILWLPYAIYEAIQLIKTEKIDIIYAVGPPHSSLVIGILLKLIVNLPIVVDLKDDWIDNPEYMSGRSRTLERLGEAFVIKNADRIILVTKRSFVRFQQRYPTVSTEKFELITNGFDRNDMDMNDIDTFCKNDKFVIAHAGLLHELRNPIPFFKALKEIKNSKICVYRDLKVLLMGTVIEQYQNYIRKTGLEDIIECTGMVSHKDCIRNLYNSSFLLLIPSVGISNSIPGKIYEYMAINRPILMLSEDNASADLFTKYNIGKHIYPQNIKGIKAAILEYYDDFKQGQLSIDNTQFIQKFDRESLTERLVSVFNQVV